MRSIAKDHRFSESRLNLDVETWDNSPQPRLAHLAHVAARPRAASAPPATAVLPEWVRALREMAAELDREMAARNARSDDALWAVVAGERR